MKADQRARSASEGGSDNPQPAIRNPQSEEGVQQESAATPAHAPAELDDGLKRAAACMERGDEAGAVPHLTRHMREYPEQIMIRAYLAELLLRLKRYPEAAWHFETFVAAAQEQNGPARKHLIHCHTRLMEIAQAREDDYGERLHRGIGMYLLARQQAGDPETQDAAFTEQLLCKAASELTEAHKLRPGDARASWYLYEAWSALGQARPAKKALRAARAAAPFSTLTPSEQRGLFLACPVAPRGLER